MRSLVLQVMEPGGWRSLFYSVVYATSLSVLQSVRNKFHATVCAAVTAADGRAWCACDARVAWAVVSALPKGAVVQWQFATSRRPLHLHVMVSAVAADEIPPPAHPGCCRFVLFKCGAVVPPHLGLPIVPVVRFLEESVNYGVSRRYNYVYFRYQEVAEIYKNWIKKLDIDKHYPQLPEASNLAPLVPHNECLRKLVELGADLSRMESEPGVANLLVKTDFNTAIAPKLWLLCNFGFELPHVSRIMTRVPKSIIKLSVEEIASRLKYFSDRGFSSNDVIRNRVLSTNAFHLHRRLQLPFDQIALCPRALCAPPRILAERTNFLKLSHRFQPDRTKPLYTPLDAIVEGTDGEFCQRFAEGKEDLFNDYLRTI
ncbi:mTERF domain-containing protein [Echinococcus granulosus]|uniref:mTERF domain-containing protein n=1 Tax=Echinococcus granulosus TaxID=6210 RepID=W6UND6_ECHGR|nr:mTERF domain-containing protein [Echinococcus granulosus]EUB62678.1 mTERF domain-containing protein [Echinococcus granulosus]